MVNKTGMTRRSFLATSGILALSGLVGCGSSSSSSEGSSTGTTSAVGTTEASNEPVPVEIVESGYYITSSGYVMYGIVWKNPNTKYGVQFPAVNITGKDAEGKVVFSDKQVMSSMLPGEQQQFGMQAGNGTAPATVEFSIVDGDTQYIETSNPPQEWLTISNTNEVVGDFNTSYTGEMTTNSDELEEYSQAWVSVILRDANGAIVYGCNSFADIAANGSSSTFEVSAYSELPEHASYELTAIPWY